MELAGGVITGLEGAREIRGWQWLFISKGNRIPLDNHTDSYHTVEGSLTMFSSIIFIFILPNWPANTKWLMKEEKALAAARIKADQVGSVQLMAGNAITCTVCLIRLLMLCGSTLTVQLTYELPYTSVPHSKF